MRKIARFIIACIMLIFTAVSLPAGGRTERKMPDRVRVYSSVDDENTRKLLDVFTAETGVAAQFMHLSSDPALIKIREERKKPQADVWLGAPNEYHIIAREEGLTVPYKSAVLDKVDARFKDRDGYWYAFYRNPIALGVNIEALAKVNAPLPASWEDLCKPVYFNLIQMPTPQFSGTGYNILASLVTLWGEEKAFMYMKKLRSNVQVFTTSGIAPAQAAAVGQCAIAIQFTPAYFKFIDQGYPLKVIFPAEGVGFEAPAVSILKGAANIKAAEKLVDWLLSKKGQDTLAHTGTHFYPLNPEAVQDSSLPPLSSIKIIDYNPDWAGENKAHLVKRWENEILSAQ